MKMTTKKELHKTNFPPSTSLKRFKSVRVSPLFYEQKIKVIVLNFCNLMKIKNIKRKMLNAKNKSWKKLRVCERRKK